MITGRRSSFEARCRERGYTLDEVRPCIVSQDGDRITVDVDHPAYPRRRKPGVSLLTKARNFAASAAKHIAAGAPQATEEEVARRFAICETCEHFDGKACRQCGCPVVRQKKFLSKLSWANEKCPVGNCLPAHEINHTVILDQNTNSFSLAAVDSFGSFAYGTLTISFLLS